MVRPPTKSVARVYRDVNAQFGPAWHEYGRLFSSLVPHVSLTLPNRQSSSSVGLTGSLRDSAQSRPRKILRGMTLYLLIARSQSIHILGFRGRPCHTRRKMHHKSAQARQKEKDKTRNKDLAKSRRRSKHCSSPRRRSRPSFKNSKPCHRIRRQRRFQGPIPAVHRL